MLGAAPEGAFRAPPSSAASQKPCVTDHQIICIVSASITNKYISDGSSEANGRRKARSWRYYIILPLNTRLLLLLLCFSGPLCPLLIRNETIPPPLLLFRYLIFSTHMLDMLLSYYTVLIMSDTHSPHAPTIPFLSFYWSLRLLKLKQ